MLTIFATRKELLSRTALHKAYLRSGKPTRCGTFKPYVRRDPYIRCPSASSMSLPKGSVFWTDHLRFEKTECGLSCTTAVGSRTALSSQTWVWLVVTRRKPAVKSHCRYSAMNSVKGLSPPNLEMSTSICPTGTDCPRWTGDYGDCIWGSHLHRSEFICSDRASRTRRSGGGTWVRAIE